MVVAASNGKPRRKLPPAWWGTFPSLALLVLFIVYPLVQVLGFSTLRWDGVAVGKAIGLGNYSRMASDPDLWRSLLITVGFAAITLPAFVFLSLFISLELEGSRLERPLKAIMFLPGLWTVGASAIGWYTLYAPDYGLLASLTGGRIAIPWSSEGWAALLIVSLFTVWQHVGYGILVVSAGLKNVPGEILEAARVDGAREGQLRRFVILPMLRPSIVFLGVVGSIYALQSYTAVFLLTRGGPFGATRVVGYFLYETAFEKFEFGYAAALTVLVLALAFALAAWQARALRDEL